MGGLIKPLVSLVDVIFCIYGSAAASLLFLLSYLATASVSRSGELQPTSALLSVMDVPLLLLYGSSFPFTKRSGLLELRRECGVALTATTISAEM